MVSIIPKKNALSTSALVNDIRFRFASTIQASLKNRDIVYLRTVVLVQPNQFGRSDKYKTCRLTSIHIHFARDAFIRKDIHMESFKRQM